MGAWRTSLIRGMGRSEANLTPFDLGGLAVAIRGIGASKVGLYCVRWMRDDELKGLRASIYVANILSSHVIRINTRPPDQTGKATINNSVIRELLCLLAHAEWF